MRFILLTCLLFSSFFCTSAFSADAPKYIVQYKSTVEDIKAINKVITDFQLAIKTKNSQLLSTLVLDNSILFTSPSNPQMIEKIRLKRDSNFNGIMSGGYPSFASFITEEKKEIEEKFYNIKIVQDKNIAWVTFDFEFIIDGSVDNFGIEVWQLMKVKDDQWKIFSVVWTNNSPPE